MMAVNVLLIGAGEVIPFVELFIVKNGRTYVYFCDISGTVGPTAHCLADPLCVGACSALMTLIPME